MEEVKQKFSRRKNKKKHLILTYIKISERRRNEDKYEKKKYELRR